MSRRQQYFAQIATGQKLTYQEWCREVFFHPIGDYMRLNRFGLELFKSHLTHHIVDSVTDTGVRASKHYIFLSRFCRQPYYIAPSIIVFFDEEEAFLFKLCDGDVDNVAEVAPEKLI